ncbi:MAG: YqcI/YcgG family protein, partial [Gammaproteobacteria bacterium]|nr:YqcI/YcgG family protein [Gammaproteobacteria bacterium]
KLHHIDASNWPKEISEDPEHHLWEFSFSGEPIFVVCNNPAHKLRRSRYASTFMITFQPRWVFEFLQKPAGEKSKKIVREILKSYDDIDVHPELGTYGDEKNKEWLQYYLSDTNETNGKKCPFQLKEK